MPFKTRAGHWIWIWMHLKIFCIGWKKNWDISLRLIFNFTFSYVCLFSFDKYKNTVDKVKLYVWSYRILYFRIWGEFVWLVNRYSDITRTLDCWIHTYSTNRTIQLSNIAPFYIHLNSERTQWTRKQNDNRRRSIRKVNELYMLIVAKCCSLCMSLIVTMREEWIGLRKARL